jgi:hypothetical protein
MMGRGWREIERDLAQPLAASACLDPKNEYNPIAM